MPVHIQSEGVIRMTAAHSQAKEAEAERLAHTVSVIRSQIVAFSDKIDRQKDDVMDARKDMWKYAPRVVQNFEDVTNLAAATTGLNMQEENYVKLMRKHKNLQKIVDTPYFARIDFEEDDFDETENIYIGMQSVTDETDNDPLVYDWRTPIASLYYDSGVGRVSFSVPMDGGRSETVRGTLHRKRQYHITGGRLHYFFDTDLAIGDEILQRELAKASDGKIKTIIHSIQAFQNQAIRAEAKHLLVTGPAGSGKTSVGLHRLAYLLYRYRDTLTSGQIRIFSPNLIFASYIDGIIPALGEEEVQTLDFTSLLLQYYPLTDHTSPAQTPPSQYEQISFLAAPDDAVRAVWLAETSSPAFVRFLTDYVQNYRPSFSDDIMFNTDRLCPKEKLAELYQGRTATDSLATKTARVISYINQSYREYFDTHRKTVGDFFCNLYDDNFNNDEILQRYEAEKQIVLNDLRNRLMPSAARLYERALREWAKRQNRPHVGQAVHRFRNPNHPRLYEDALAIFYIDVLTGKIDKNRTVKHILLDEAQDQGYMQHSILKKLYADAHFTVLGDANQALYPHINLQSDDELIALYGQAGQALHIPLRQRYRSTYEINRFSARLLGTPDESTFFDRHGDEPAVLDVADPYAAVANLLANHADIQTFGILLPTAAEANTFYKNFRARYPKTPLTLIAHPDDEYIPGAVVMAVPFAKGLEFDGVIIPTHTDALDKKLLYLMCTRALHKLWLIRGGADRS